MPRKTPFPQPHIQPFLSNSQYNLDSQLSQSHMEAILRPDSVLFETLISDLLSSSEEKRSEAESMFNMMKQKDPDSLALKLAEFIGSSQVFVFREKCIVLLEKLLTDDELCTWRNLSQLTQSTIKCVLLDCLKVEESKTSVKRLGHTIQDIAISLVPENNWPELLPFLYQSLTDSSSNNYLKVYALLIFGELANDMAENIVSSLNNLPSLFRKLLNDDTVDLNARALVLTAAVKIILCLQSFNEKQRFQNLLPAMMSTLTKALSNGEVVLFRGVLLYLVILGKDEPRFFRMLVEDVIGTMFEIVEAKSLDEVTRILAVELVLTLVEAREKAPGMIKKLRFFNDTCFVLLLDMLLDIKDEPSWHSAQTEHKEAGLEETYHGLHCLRRFCKALGGKNIDPIAIDQLSAYMAAPDWEKRHAALCALACISSCSKIAIECLEQVVKLVLHAIEDPHPRVRWAATASIALLSIDFFPDLQEKCSNEVLPLLIAAMDDFENPRVQAEAALSVSTFCGSEMPEILVPYIDGIHNKLLVLLQNDKQMVQQAALNALGAIAVSSKEQFQKYYDIEMPYLKTILVNANDKSNHVLRSNTLECISRFAMAVGKEKFRDDLKQVMELLKSLQESQAEEFDSIVCIIRACFRICKCMGKEFLPYMHTVMPPLVEFAQLELDKTVTDAIEDSKVLSLSDKTAMERWTMDPPRTNLSIHKVKFGDRIICARGKDLLEGKSMACALLGEYAQTLEEDFYPWISQAAAVLIPLLKLYINNDVRRKTIYAMSYLLGSAKLAAEQGVDEWYLKQLSGNIIQALGNALYSEPEAELCAVILHQLNLCLEICAPLLSDDQVCSIINEIKHTIIESSRRNGERMERANSEDFDAEEAELLRKEREIELVVFIYVGMILTTLIRTFETAFLPFFDELSSYLMPMMGKDKTAEERHTCISIFDELVEHCGEAALKYFNIYLPFLLDSSNDENPGVRQDALNGLGLCAVYGGSIFKPFVEEALSRIDVVITHCHAREPENVGLYDNAVFALCKICQFHHESIDSAKIIPAWLNCLPIKYNMVEAQLVHKQLCSMVERSDKDLLGINYLHFPKVISVFAEVICAGEDLATEETAKRMINLLRQFQQTVPPATWESAWSLLLPQQEMELASILSPDQDVNL